MRKEKLVEFGQRVTEKMGEMSLKELALRIGKSYEMTRRYAKGWAMPDDPKTLEALAAALNTSVGYLLADEIDSSAMPPLVEASHIEGPISAPTRMLIEDDAMVINVDNIRLFGVGDQAILYPRKPLPGDIVAVRHRGGTTLRRVVETEQGHEYVPRVDGYATIRTGQVVGVVAEVHGRVARLS